MVSLSRALLYVLVILNFFVCSRQVGLCHDPGLTGVGLSRTCCKQSSCVVLSDFSVKTEESYFGELSLLNDDCVSSLQSLSPT